MDTFDTLDKEKVNSMVSAAISDLDSTLSYIINAKFEIQNKFSGESFDAYIAVLNKLYEEVKTTKDQLSNLYR